MHITAQSRNFQAGKYAVPSGRPDVTVDGADRKSGNDLAGENALERVRSWNVAEGEGIEVLLGGIANRGDAGFVERITHAHALQRTPQLVAQRGAEASRGLGKVLQCVEDCIGQVERCAGQNLRLLGLVELIALGKDTETELQGPVKEIGLCEAELDIAFAVTDIGGDG